LVLLPTVQFWTSYLPASSSVKWRLKKLLCVLLCVCGMCGLRVGSVNSILPHKKEATGLGTDKIWGKRERGAKQRGSEILN
jgi:hypothetical protein